MVLINCACCAAPLPHPAKQCSRCKTLYCSPACQKQHWEQGGHDKLCRKIRKGGGAEQYHADIKFKEAVAVAADAAEAFKEDAKGQKCYICGDDKEGLVRMCACCGTAGFAHVSCLAEQAKSLMDEVEENNLSDRALEKRWERWHKCGQCEQNYHGIVACALGWACWKTHVGRPETELARTMAMGLLGSGLFSAKHHKDALVVREAEISSMQRFDAPPENILAVQANLAMSYGENGDLEKALSMERDIYSGWLKLLGVEHERTLQTASNYAISLLDAERYGEARSLLRKTMPVARHSLGDSNEITFRMRSFYAKALFLDDDAPLDELHEAVNTLEDNERTARRVMGGAHPLTQNIGRDLKIARKSLHLRRMRSICEGVGAMTT